MELPAGATGSLPTVSVLVPTHKRPSDLTRCLAGLAAQSLPPDEVLVVLRPKDADSRGIVASGWRLPVREVVVDRPGAVAARNAGLAVAIPAVLAYNVFGKRVAASEAELEGFAHDLREMIVDAST